MVGMNALCVKEGPLEKLAQGRGAHQRAWLKEPWPSGGPGVTQKRPSQAPSPRGESHPPGLPPSVCASFGASSSPAPTPLPSGQARNSAAELSFEHPDLPPAPQGPGGEWTPPPVGAPAPLQRLGSGCSPSPGLTARPSATEQGQAWGQAPLPPSACPLTGLPGRHTWA